MSSQITKNVFDAWVARLANVSTGFNPNLAAIAIEYGIEPFEIDFGADSQNFLQSSVADMNRFLGAADVTTPFLTLDISRGFNARPQQAVKFVKFAGPLVGTCQVFLSFGEALAGVDFTSLPQCVIDAMYKTMNDQTISQRVAWPNGILYGGELDFNISPLVPGLQGWMRAVTFTATFRQITI